MAKHDVDPVLRQLVRAVNESAQAEVPVAVSVHGATLTGTLIAQSRYFSELITGNPLMSALEPNSGLLGKDYAKEAETESEHHLHLRLAGGRGGNEITEGPWRISLESVDGWALGAGRSRRRGEGTVRAPARHPVTAGYAGRATLRHGSFVLQRRPSGKHGQVSGQAPGPAEPCSWTNGP